MLKKLAVISALLAFVVVVFGAFVRLSDAGLGCPDWPGCYGHIAVPQSAIARQSALQNFPNKTIEPAKAWLEMIHRYLAGTLGLLILAMAILSWRNRHNGASIVLPTLLVGLVGFQAALGMWTVTLLLKPVIVTLHLLGGMATLSLLVWLALRHVSSKVPTNTLQLQRFRNWARIGVLVLFIQIALGGWVSSNYAALACTEFPLCQSQWLPPVDFSHGFQFMRELGVTASGAPLSNEALTAIHWTHRLGALITFMVLLPLAWRGCTVRPLRLYGGLVLTFLIAQVSIGIANVMLSLPLALAVAHNAMAALLLIAMVTLNFKLNPLDQKEYQPV